MKFVPIASGLIEHCPRMRESVWLFIYIVDKQTKGVKDGRGQVLGGSPIRDSDIAAALRVSSKTVSRWREALLSEGYISARRTPYGFVYAVSKPKKWQKEIGQECPLSDQTQTVERSDTNGERSDKVVRNKEEREETEEREDRENREDKQEREKGREAHAPRYPPQVEKAIQYIWSNYLYLIEPGDCYSLTPNRKRMIATRLREIEAQNISRENAVNTRIVPAIKAFAEDDYFMGRKRGYEGPGRKGIEEIFKTQEIFENWCSKMKNT